MNEMNYPFIQRRNEYVIKMGWQLGGGSSSSKDYVVVALQIIEVSYYYFININK